MQKWLVIQQKHVATPCVQPLARQRALHQRYRHLKSRRQGTSCSAPSAAFPECRQNQTLPHFTNPQPNATVHHGSPWPGVQDGHAAQFIFEPKVLEELVRLFNSEQIKPATGDVYRRIYEYFLAKFSMQKAHDNGEFFTPSWITFIRRSGVSVLDSPSLPSWRDLS